MREGATGWWERTERSSQVLVPQRATWRRLSGKR
uniref:Uncharacterized protein n=1 Tax=Anguilla anguilla TaxID=7936 RepID=A0A0E9TEK6_ANGAN